jgi:diaminopimelate decarboxylase
MTAKTLPFTLNQLEAIEKNFPTPFHVYDERGIRENARRLKRAFAWNPGFKEYFAVKACPNPFLMKIVREEGFGMDCSSLPELLLSESIGSVGEEIMFTSNDTPADEFVKAKALGAIINLDDLSHIAFLEHAAGIPERVCFRYNPGPLKGGNAIIGNPEQAKYGFTREQLFEGYRLLKDKGVKHFGLHTMVASNELNPQYFIDTAEILFQLAAEISKEVGITFEFINVGGGIGIPYKPEQVAVDLEFVGEGMRQAYQKYILDAGHPPLKLYMECGRMVTGPYGFLVSRVRHIKKTYKTYADSMPAWRT